MRRASKISLLLVTCLVAVPLLVALLLLIGAASLENQRVRSALLERANRHLKTTYGVTVELDRYAIRPLSGSLEARGLSVSGPQSESFFSADALEVSWRPWSLMRLAPEVTTLRLDSPRIDLDRLPSFGLGEPTNGGEVVPLQDLPLAIDQLLLRGASVSKSGDGRHFDSFRVSALDARARLDTGEFELEIETGRLELKPVAPLMPLDLEITGRAEGDLAGRWKIESLRLTGRPLQLEVRGSGSTTTQAVTGTAEVDLALYLPALLVDAPTGAQDGSPVRVRATTDLGRRIASFSVDAADQPADLLEPWLPLETARILSLGETRIGLEAHGEISLGREAAPGSAEAEIGVTVSTEGTTLAELQLRPRLAGSAAQTPFELLLLPDSQGERKVNGLLETGSLEPGSAFLQSAQLTDGKVKIDQPRLSELTEVLRAWSPDPFPTTLAAGSVRAEGNFSGPLTNPALKGRLSWRPERPEADDHSNGGIDFELDGRPADRTGRLITRADNLDARLVSPNARGDLSWTGSFEADRGNVDGRLALEGAGISTASGGPTLETLALTADLADGALTWKARGDLEDAGSVRSFDASGELPRLGGPISEAGASVHLRLAEGPFRGLDLRAELAEGAVGVDLLPTRLGDGRIFASARLPLATLAGVAGLETIRELPLERAKGDLTFEWTAENNDWTELVGGYFGPGSSGLVSTLRRLRGGSTGSLRLDPAQPALATGRLTVTGLEIQSDDLEAVATQPILAEIDNGTITLPEVRLDTNLGPLTVQGDVFLDAAWSLESDPIEAVRDLILRATVSTETGQLADFFGVSDGDGNVHADTARHLVAEVTLKGPLDGLRGDLLVQSDNFGWSTQGDFPVETAGALEARLNFDPLHLGTLEGVIEIPTLSLTVGGRNTRIAAPLRIEVDRGDIRLRRVELVGESEAFSLEGEAKLSQGEEPFLASAHLEGAGTLDAALLNPWLTGGVATGPLNLNMNLSVEPRDSANLLARLAGNLRIAGEGAAVLFTSPYVTRITQPEIHVGVEGGRGTLDGTVQLNEGSVELSGGTVADGGLDGDLALRARLAGVRYRLDHGLLARINADLDLALRQGLPTVGGTVELDRGVLTRRMDLDLDFISSLLAPVDLTTTRDDLASQVALDLEFSTREGVWIKNNIGNLQARWEPIHITGTVAAPILDGRIEVDPGGLLYAYGQTVRLDRAAIEYPGQAGVEPRLELETTSSFQDPTIGKLAGNDLLTAEPERIVAKKEQGDKGEEVDATADATTGLATFWGEQIASRLSESLGGAKISIRPVLIFGETDPGARLTLSRDVSPSFSLAASLDLRNAQRQTYLLDVHRLRRLPQFNGQLFTTDLDERGVTARQTLEFGGGSITHVDIRPRLHKLRFERPPGTTRRGFKRALGVRKGDEMGDDEVFALEIEAAEYLRRRGYPDARVQTELRPTGKRGRQLAIELRIETGPRVEFLFSGDPPPRALQATITSLYRTDFYESTSLEEMKQQAVRVFRSRGHLDPQVRIEVTSADPSSSSFERRVTLDSEAGIRVETLAPRFEGVSEEDAEFLTARFTSPVQRTELAMGLPEADQRLFDAMGTLGYPTARIESRFSGREDPRLTIVLRAGPRKRIAGLRLVGMEDDEAERLLELTGLSPSDPARGDRLALAALLTEEELRRQGRAAARVRVSAAPRASNELEIDVTLEVAPGSLHHLDEIHFSGLRSTRDSWASKVSGLVPGEILRREDIADARTELFSTGLFSSVAASVDPEAGLVRFDLEETSRFQFAYGLRWESSQDGSAVIDFTDRNLFGRSVTFGLRGLYSTNDRSIRWLTTIPRPFGGRGALELFARGREETDGGILTETIESSIQYSLPVGGYSTARVYVRYRDIRLTEEDPDPFFPLDERIKTPLLGFQYIYDSRAGGSDPERGVFATVDLSGAEEFLGSDFRFARVYGQVNLYRPAFVVRGRRAVWAQSYRLGFAEAFGGQGLPREHRFFAGGEYSVRGYELESLGPQETLGSFERALGGRSLAILNQELRIPIFDILDTVAFVDAGQIRGASDDLGPGRQVDNPSGFFSAIGAGIRARTPIGLLRLDLAYPLDRRDFDPATTVYLGFGNAF
ncbi:MAG: BamA/TamA family outer membrane protein [Acidobacteriota bacterium]|nr:BamA/TamA family outer membrane protein [Acidobacteriota bacterium]